MEVKQKVVDIEDALRGSNSKFVKKLPKFIINWVKRVVREDELNRIHAKYSTLEGMDYVKALLFDEFNTTIKIEGEENVDKDKRYVYVANHPLGAIDALGHLYLVDKMHGKVVSPSNELFEYIPNLHSLIVGIDVFNQNTKERAQKVNEAFDSDTQIMIFPAGEVSRKIKGEIIDPVWQKTFVTKALQSKRDIVPIYISGCNSKKFYRTAKTRKMLGIKIYIETLLLPQEMLKKRNAEMVMKIGKPFSQQEIRESKKSHVEWAQKIKDYVYSLK